MTKSFFYTFFLGILLVIPNCIYAQSLFIEQQDSVYVVGEHMFVLEDTSNILSIDEVVKPTYQAKFLPVTQEVPSFGVSQSSFWVRFAVNCDTSFNEKWILQIATTEVGEVTLYSKEEKGNYVSQTVSSYVPFDKRAVKSRFFAFHLPLQKGVNIFYVKTKFDFLSSLPLFIKTEKKFREQDFQEQTILILLYGVLLAMVVYNLFLAFYLREKVYYFYVAYIFFYGLSQTQISNVNFAYFWENFPEWNRTSLLVMISVSQIISVYFAKSYLRIDVFLPKANIIFKIVLAITAFWLILFLAAFWGADKYIGMHGVMLASGIYMILMIFSPLIIIRKGYKPAIFFFIAWIFVVAGGQVALLKQLGILSINFFTTHASLIGFVLQTILLALGLAYRINLMRDEIKHKELEQIRIQEEEAAKRAAIIEEKNRELEQKVALRTVELVEKNEEVNQQNEELRVTSEQLILQHELLSSAHNDIKSSINYAKRIQDALFPTNQLLDDILQDYFVFFRPRDVVSGDFYWASKTETKSFFVIADCTGHGVPGAFMSLLGANLLDKIINSEEKYTPTVILDELRRLIRIQLKQKESANQDGMDITVVAISREEKILEFASAKRPMIYFQNNELVEIKGSSIFIGGTNDKDIDKQFELHQISFATPTNFYFFTDGYPDQFGGDSGEPKKFMIKKFRQMLQDVQPLPMKKQKETISQRFMDWKGKESQIDDVLVVGMRME